jgi:hypothetical protein
MEKGVMMEGISPSTHKFFYRYSPLGIMPNKIESWLTKSEGSIKKEASEKGFSNVQIRPVYWYAKKYSCIRVYKDSNWITNHIAEFYRFWRTIEYYRENGVENLEEFMKTGKSDCLPKHPGIIDFLDMTIRKSKNTKTANLFKKKCVIDVSDDDNDDNDDNDNNGNDKHKTKKQKKSKGNTKSPLQKGCMILSDSGDEDLSIF